MKSNKLVSIIIPVFNVEKYVGFCLQSVLDQTYNLLEIIIVDDGSIDNSFNICKEFAKNDKRVKLFHKENGGLSDARNYGIKHASGDFIFFLDSDDLIQNNTIEILINTLKDNNSIALCCFERFVDRYNEIKEYKIKKYTPRDFFVDILELNSSTYACGILIPKKFISNNFFIKNRFYEDLSSMYYIYSKCQNIYKINAGLYKYRINPNSIVHTSNQKKIVDYEKSANEMIDFIKNNYNIDIHIFETYKSEVLRSCYIMSGNEKYLDEAKKIVKKASYRKLSLKNRIKIYLLHNKKLTKLFIKIKNN